jgi:hypothetical protein
MGETINTKFITNFKTEICKNWVVYGVCKYDKKCHYAHGEGEIRKKILCAYFLTKEGCTDEKCKYLHFDPSNLEQIYDELYYARSEQDNLLATNGILQKERDFLLVEQSKLLFKIFELQNALEHSNKLNSSMVQGELANQLKIHILLDEIKRLESENNKGDGVSRKRQNLSSHDYEDR